MFAKDSVISHDFSKLDMTSLSEISASFKE